MKKHLNLSKKPILEWMMKFFMKYQHKKNEFIHNLEKMLKLVRMFQTPLMPNE